MAVPLHDMHLKPPLVAASPSFSASSTRDCHDSDDPSRFSFEADDHTSTSEFDSLQPRHSGLTSDSDDYRPAGNSKHFDSLLNGKSRRPGFLRTRSERELQLRKLRAGVWVPRGLRLGRAGRLCALIAGFLALLIFLGVGGTGWWVYRVVSTIDGDSPPWYPSPLGGTSKRWAVSYDKSARMVSQMTLAEKVNITTGTGWMMGLCVGNTAPATIVGFPALCLQDGPLGVRFADNITASPAGVTVGATWNKELMYKRGKLLGLEFRAKGAHVMLGPTVGPLGRMPAGGRNWEGFGADPVLQGIAAAQTIRGIQEEGVQATIKHLIGNEQEHFRQSFEWGLPNAMSSNIDDRTLHELYLWPFADSVKAGVASVMCSYNQLNNSYACQNSWLMNGLLKDELGFQGYVQSDWGAQRSGVASALAGLDMSMPGDGSSMGDGKSFWGPELTLAALNGSLKMERLDDMVTRVVAAWYQLGQDDLEKFPGPNFSSWTNDEVGLIHPGSDDKTTGVVNHFVDAKNMGGYSHRSLVRRIAAEGTVLLKNDENILPLSRKGWSQSVDGSGEIDGKKYRIAVFGEDSVLMPEGPNGCPDRGCNHGTLAMGWGSASVEFPYLISPQAALEEAFHGDSVELTLFPTNDLSFNAPNRTSVQEQDLCIVFVNADSGEGYINFDGISGDRNDLKIQKGADELIAAVSSKCGTKNRRPNLLEPESEALSSVAHGSTIVVIHTVGPVLLEEFIENQDVRAVILANLPGQESGTALKDVLLGDVNPSGHLPWTIAKTFEDYGPSAELIYYPNGVVPQQDFTEGLLTDYRHFDFYNIEPRYPFGHGLSYTAFNLTSLVITPNSKIHNRPTALPASRPANEAMPPSYAYPPAKPADLVFPPSWRKLKDYIYPYIDSVDDVKEGKYPYPNMRTRNPSPAGGGEGGNPALYEVLATIEVTLENTGERDGQAVVQLYVNFPEGVYEDTAEGEKEEILFPKRVLRGFEKVSTYVDREIMKEGKEKEETYTSAAKKVRLELTRRDLSYWSVRRQNWVVPTGSFGVEVGFSSRDLRVRGKLF